VEIRKGIRREFKRKRKTNGHLRRNQPAAWVQRSDISKIVAHLRFGVKRRKNGGATIGGIKKGEGGRQRSAGKQPVRAEKDRAT